MSDSPNDSNQAPLFSDLFQDSPLETPSEVAQDIQTDAPIEAPLEEEVIPLPVSSSSPHRFHLFCQGPFTPEGAEKIEDLLEAFQLRSLFQDHPWKEAGQLKIPYLNAFQLVWSVQKLRTFMPLKWEFSPPADSALAVEEQPLPLPTPEALPPLPAISHPCPPCDLTKRPPLLNPDLTSSRSDLVFASGWCRRPLDPFLPTQELSDSERFNTLLEKLKLQLQQKAFYRGALSISEIQISIQPAGLSWEFSGRSASLLDRLLLVGVCHFSQPPASLEKSLDNSVDNEQKVV